MWFKKKDTKEKIEKIDNKEKNTKLKKERKIEKDKKPIYRVTFSKKENVWQIKKDGAKRVIDSKVTKEEALIRVKELSVSQDLKFVVHKKDGKFQKK